MLKVRRSRDRLVFNMGIPIPGKDGLYIETGPRSWDRVNIRRKQMSPIHSLFEDSQACFNHTWYQMV